MATNQARDVRKEFAAKLAATANRFEPDLIDALLRAFADMQSDFDRMHLTRLLDAGDILGVLALFHLDSIATALEPAGAIVVEAFVKGETLGAALVPKIRFTFGGRHREAEAVAARQAAEMVTNISVETKLALRGAVLGAIRDGIPRPNLERTIRGLVGLNTQQTAATLAYRQSLVDAGFTLDRVNDLSDRYTKKQLHARASTIARTETLGAMNAGARESWLQAQRDGLLGPAVKKEWIAGVEGAHGACERCAALDGVAVPLREMFPYEGGPKDGPPGHPRCRCCAAVVP